jgi:hypothetical protein
VASTLPLAIGAGFAKGWTAFPKIIIGETLEELYIDPWIEAYVSGYADEQGWSILGKAFSVSFAESGRETFGSSVSSGLRAVFSVQSSQNLQSQAQSHTQSVRSAQQLKADRITALKQTIPQIALSSIMLFAGSVSPMLSIIGSYTSGVGIGVIKLGQKVGFKRLLAKIHPQTGQADTEGLLSDDQTNIISQELSPIITKEFNSLTDKQKNYDKSESLIQRTFEWVKEHKKQIALYTGLTLGGILAVKTINTLFRGLNEVTRTMLSGATLLGVGTLGVVKTRHPTVTPQPIFIDDLLVSVIDRYRQKIMKFASEDISINTRTSAELMKIHSKRKLYHWNGIIYKISLKKDPITGHDLLGPGYGRFIIGYTHKSILRRWYYYISDAMTNKRTGGIYTIIKELVNHPNKNVNDYFKLEILEVSWDQNHLLARETFWIDRLHAKDPLVGFNLYEGGSGSTRINLPIEGLIRYVAEGYWVLDMPSLFLRDYRISVATGTIRKRIIEYFGSISRARREYLKPLLERFIKYGYQAKDIYNKFPGFRIHAHRAPQDKISYLCEKYWKKNYRTLRHEWLKDGIDYYLKKGMGGSQMWEFFPGTSIGSINHYIQQHYGSLDEARLTLIKPLLELMLTQGKSDQEIIKELDWSVIYINSYPFVGPEIVQYFTNQFWNMDSNKARIVFHTKNIGRN